MKKQIVSFIVSAAVVASASGAVYNVNTGTTATATGFAATPAGTASDPSAAALTDSNPDLAGIQAFSGFQSTATVPAGIIGIGVFGTWSGPGNTGTFSSLLDSDITAATSLTDLVASFQLFGATGAFNQAGPSVNRGVFARNTSGTVNGSIFDAKNIYILIGNVASGFGDSTQLAVVKHNTQQFLAAQDPISTALAVSVSSSTSTLLFGRQLNDVKTTGADSSVTLGWGTAAVVPEPSAALLGAFGVLGLLRRRRI